MKRIMSLLFAVLLVGAVSVITTDRVHAGVAEEQEVQEEVVLEEEVTEEGHETSEAEEPELAEMPQGEQ